MTNTALERLVKIGDALFTKRAQVDSLWQELADHFFPERAYFTRTYVEGDDYASWLFDSTPVMFRRDLGNNLSSILRPPSSIWFKVRTGVQSVDEKTVNREWLDSATSILRRHYYMPISGTVKAMKECDHDFVTFGNGAISCMAKPEGYLSTRNHHLRDVVWMENDDGTIDHVQRRRKITGRNILKKWPNALPGDVKAAIEQDPTSEYKCRHICVPAEEYFDDMNSKRAKKRQPFISIWVLVDKGCHVLEETPLQQNCYVIPRWHTMSDSQYAVSPAAVVALPDARMLQDMKRTLIEAAEKSVDPPVVATEDAVQGGVNLYAGGITWLDADYDERLGAGLRALELGKNPALGIDIIQDIRATLADGWFINKLNLPASGDMTAYEAQQRVKEYVRAAMPIFEPFGSSYSSPVLDLQFSLLMKMGVFGAPNEIPEDLQGREIEFQFDTPLQEAEGRSKVIAFGEVTQIVGTAARIDPASAKNVDAVKAMRDAVEGTGAPADWLIDADSLEEADDTQNGGIDLEGAAQVLPLVKEGGAAAKNVAEAVKAIAGGGNAQ